MPSPANSTATERNILGGRTSVGGSSPGSASRSRMPQAFVTAFARTFGTASCGTHPSIHDTTPCVASASRAAAKAMRSRSSG